VAYVFGRREDQAILKLKGLLAPLGIHRFYTDGWSAYQRHSDQTFSEKGHLFFQSY
jgi:insertion element IS1 protein InsB